MDQTLKLLNEKRGRARLGYLLHSLVLLTIIAMMFQGHYPLALGLGVLALFLYLYMVRRATRELNEDYTRSNLQLTLSAQLQDLTYHAKAQGMLESLREEHLLPLMDRGLLTYHRVTGRAGDMAVELMDVSTPVQDASSRGRTKFLSGVWVRMTLDEAKLPGRACAYSEDLYTDYALDGFAVGGFPQAHNKNAQAAGEEQILWLWEPQAREIYSAAQDAVEDLARYTPGDVAIAFNGRSCNVFIQRRFLAGRGVSLKTPMTAEQLSFDHFPELGRVLAIARSLHLAEPSDFLEASQDTGAKE